MILHSGKYLMRADLAAQALNRADGIYAADSLAINIAEYERHLNSVLTAASEVYQGPDGRQYIPVAEATDSVPSPSGKAAAQSAVESFAGVVEPYDGSALVQIR
ncbi:hypothetical protein ABB55_03310 [Prosthecomicrobium hirschii]|uniref:Uncharacterized protein n=1 Tax=Prosthecodimorpha hirschii TaxID=665126 RepID=A0A0P6VWY4_9HYPH|nr:hypothetical protein [Prosthecomicrobium hirschii]KPL51374.1 hypothetical protein ABB55_03310 [Prosthecomicrobium hirschii]